MTRYMIDSVTAGQLAPGQLVDVPGYGRQPVALRAGYVNGKYANAAAVGAEVTIDVNGSCPSADVLDVEPGDATPDAVPGWIAAHTGDRPVIYTMRNWLTPIANACAAAGYLPGRDFGWWIATLDGTEAVADMTGVVAVQVWDEYACGRNIDLSIVYDDTWKPTAAPAPAPIPPTHQEDSLQAKLYRVKDKVAVYFAAPGVWHPTDMGFLATLPVIGQPVELIELPTDAHLAWAQWYWQTLLGKKE